MLDLLSGGLTIVSGVLSMFAGDDEAESARATARAQSVAARDNAFANKEALKVEYQSTIAAINQNYSNVVQNYGLKREAYMTERDAVALSADAVIEQSRIDKEMISLERDDALRQIDENVRAAKLEREYSFDAAKKAKTIAKEDAREYKKQATAVLASSRTLQAASGFDASGSPAIVDEAIMAEIEAGISKVLHRGDVEFWDEMRTVQEINRFIVNQGVDRAATSKAAEFNLENVDKRTSLELRANTIAQRQVNLKEKEALTAKHQSQNEAELAKYTAKQSYTAKRYQEDTKARTTGFTATANANAQASSAQNAGLQGLVSGISSGTNAIAQSDSFKSLAAKSNWKI